MKGASALILILKVIIIYGDVHFENLHLNPAKIADDVVSQVHLDAISAFGVKYDSQDCPGFKIIPRKEWGAKRSIPKLPRFKPQYFSQLMVHHTEGEACTTKQACMKIIKQIENLEMGHLRMPEILMHFFIGGDGNVYEGRGWYTPDQHIPGFPKFVSVGFIGQFEESAPSKTMMSTWQKFLDCYIKNNSPAKRSKGFLRHNETILAAHSDYRCTKCPGKFLKDAIYKLPHYKRCQFIDPCQAQQQFLEQVERRRQYRIANKIHRDTKTVLMVEDPKG